jgi:ABC-type antimicrobial peptide transport system permease subunit
MIVSRVRDETVSVREEAIRRGEIMNQHRPAEIDTVVSGTAPVLSVEGVSVTYATGTTALHETSIQFDDHAFTVLLGPSGAGKSTLLRSLNLLVRPTTGHIRARDMGVLEGAATIREHRRRCAMIFQQHQLIGRLSALRNVLRQPVRTLLTIVGIGIAMMSMVLLGALSAGAVDAIGGMMAGGGAHLVGMEADASVDLSKVSEDDIRRVAALPGVDAAEGFLTGYTALGELPFFIVYGYQPRGLSIRDFTIVQGESLTTNRQIILGRVAADNLDKEIGQTLRIFNQAFKIVGIYETGVSFQDGGGVVSLRDAQRLFGQPRMVSFVGVWVEDPNQAEVIAQTVETRFPEISLSLASDFLEDVGDIQMMEASTWGIATMALVVGGLGMANTMVMSVHERTREIGVLRALGWRKRRVLWMIVRESVTLSLLGGLVGTVVGVLLGYALNLHPLMKGMFRMTYSVELFAQAVGTTLVLGIVGGIYPAWRAANLQPVEALRYE